MKADLSKYAANWKKHGDTFFTVFAVLSSYHSIPVIIIAGILTEIRFGRELSLFESLK